MKLTEINKLAVYKDILFSTLSEITSLIVAGKDKRKIFEKLLHCCLVVLEADPIMRPGPRIVQGVEAMARAFYPERFPGPASPSSAATSDR